MLNIAPFAIINEMKGKRRVQPVVWSFAEFLEPFDDLVFEEFSVATQVFDRRFWAPFGVVFYHVLVFVRKNLNRVPVGLAFGKRSLAAKTSLQLDLRQYDHRLQSALRRLHSRPPVLGHGPLCEKRCGKVSIDTISDSEVHGQRCHASMQCV